MKDVMTDQQVEVEITRLLESPHVALAKAEQQVKYIRRQYMYKLRSLERRGKELEKAGISIDAIYEMDEAEC